MGNLADNIGLPRNDDDNNDNVNAFVDVELVVVSIDSAELTDIVGDNGTPFFVDTI